MKETYKALVLLSIFAVLIIIIGYFVLSESTSVNQDTYLIVGEILKTIGFTIMTLVIISTLWNLLGGEPVNKSISELNSTIDHLRGSVKLLEESNKNGLRRVSAVSGQFGSHSDWMARLKSAEQRIDLIGYTLIVWTKGENFEEELIKLLSKGVYVRILIMDDENPELTAFMNTDQINSISEAGVKENIKIMKSTFNEISSRLTQEQNNYLSFKTLKNGLITLQMCRTDDELTMVQYIYSEIASRSPLLLVKGEESTLFNIYRREFDKLWELAE